MFTSVRTTRYPFGAGDAAVNDPLIFAPVGVRIRVVGWEGAHEPLNSSAPISGTVPLLLSAS